jgi:protein-S-isoprenylcysteine O-methyltransferase Ste14/ribosomal protein S18 acetylase RimI-like enzyme
MSQSSILRRYRPADHDAVWELHNLALRETGAHLGNGPWDDDLHHIESVYLNSGGEFLVGELGDRIVVMGALKPVGPGQAEVKRMRVHPSFQRRGFGQVMLDALEHRALELGFQTLVLDTSTLQKAAQRLYLKNGFQETGRRKVRHLDIIDYKKELHPIAETKPSGTPPAPADKGDLICRAALQAVALVFVFGFVVFLPAQTLRWPMAWLLLVAYIGGTFLMNLWLILRHTDLARERMIIPRSSEKWDLRLIGIVNFLLMAVMLPLSGLDHRLHLSPPLPAALLWFALSLFVAAFIGIGWAMSVNEYFSSAIRLQTDRDQTVAAEGPYRYLRHPGNLVMILQFLVIPFVLGSPLALIPASAAATVYIYRTRREDKMLLERLPGYADYAARVRYRLIPGIW